MAQSETVERILDAAEQLFAEKGFAETSLRLITSKAGVNLAAVNYHFGSKKALIQAVFSRFLGPFCVSLEKAGSSPGQARGPARHPGGPPAPAGVPGDGGEAAQRQRPVDLHALARPGLQPEPGAPAQVPGGGLRQGLPALHAAGQRGGAEAAAHRLFWRVHFMLGAAAFSMSGIKALRAMAETDFGVNTSTEQVMHLMVPFFAAGMRAESGIDDPLLAGAQLRPRNKTPAKA